MASYSLTFKPSVLKDLRKLSGDAVERVYARIEGLAGDPFPPGVVKLSGAERLYRIRVGDYRVSYEVDSAEEAITVQYVRHRRDAYR